MKIRINVGDNSTFIVLPVHLSSAAAELLSCSMLYTRDGWGSPEIYKASADKLSLEFVADDAFAPMTEREAKAAKEANEKQSQWYTAYVANEAAQKRIKELEASLAAIQSVTVCRTVEPEIAPEAPVVAENNEVIF